VGYSTDYKGELRFTRELKASELAAVRAVLGEDIRDHKDWPTNQPYLTYMDLELTDDFGGLKWNGAEKSSPMDGLVNTLINVVRRTVPDFGLAGELHAQGEEADDRWTCVIGDDGFATRKTVVLTGTKVQCPNCDHQFRI